MSIVENHGGTVFKCWAFGSSDEANQFRTIVEPFLILETSVYRAVGGNDSGCKEWYDMYKGVSELMPYAKSVSAKSYDFDDNGNETKIDYAKMMDIVKEYNYDGFIGVEYEGGRLGRKRRYFSY